MKISRKARPTTVGMTVMGVLVAVTAAAAPAQAIPGLVRVSATSINDSSTTKTVSVACPTGTTVLGGGGEIVNGAGQVLLTALEPVPDTNSYRARGHEDDDGYTGSWRVTAYALCANSPAGLEYLSYTGSSQSTTFGHYVALRCPTGKHLIGYGGRTNNGNGDVSLEIVNPFDPYEVLVLAAEDPNGYAGLWSLTAHLVCVTPIAERQTVFASVPADSDSPKSVTVRCPGSQKVHGAGFGGGGATSYGRWLVRSVVPDATMASVTVSAEEIDGGTPDTWRLTAYAVCAPRQ
jgi:hypothetical protein